MKIRTLKTGGLVLLTLFALANFRAQASEVGDNAPCVILDGIDSMGKNTHACIRETINPNHTHTIVDFFFGFLLHL